MAAATAIHCGIVGLAGLLQSKFATSDNRRTARRRLAPVTITIWFALTMDHA